MPSRLFISRHKTKSLTVQRPQQQPMIGRLFIIATMLWVVNGQLCEKVVSNSWRGLTDAIDRSHGFAILCPFRISGEGCPKGNKSYDAKLSDLYIMCDSVSQSSFDSACVIDCPGTHFTVYPGAKLTLDGLTLTGSKSSSVQVKTQGQLTTYNAIFVNNKNAAGNGAAIDAAEGSDLSLMYSRFEKCEALNGGAVYHLGPAVISGSSFIDNRATNGGGGAVFSGARATTDLTENIFAGNSATFFAPALFDGSNAHSHQERNSACANTIDGSDVKCDGIYSISNGVGLCKTFDDECIAPTAAPTTATPSELPSISPSTEPSAQPSYKPTGPPTTSPTVAPTNRPSASPSLRPSFAPSSSQRPSVAHSTSPSLTASSGPSDNPSSTPSHSPISTPTQDPTASRPPSSVPSQAPSMSLAPSNFPSNAPSKQLPTAFPSETPSFEPSTQPSLSAIPTSSPSTQPSNAPSMTLSSAPSFLPSWTPTTMEPSDVPSLSPSTFPTITSSDAPSQSPTKSPTLMPSDAPSSFPSASPSHDPSSSPSSQPTKSPTDVPTRMPSLRPSSSPSRTPTRKPTAAPTPKPSPFPTKRPTPAPTPEAVSNDGGTYSYSFRTNRRRRGPR